MSLSRYFAGSKKEILAATGGRLVMIRKKNEGR